MIMISHLDPPYTSPTTGFYRSRHACSIHKPWAKTTVLCTWVCMHKTIGLSHGILYMKRKYTKSKALSSCFSGMPIASYLGDTRFKPCFLPFVCTQMFFRP